MKKFDYIKWVTNNKHKRPKHKKDIVQLLSEVLMKDQLPKGILNESISPKLKEGFRNHIHNLFEADEEGNKPGLNALQDIADEFKDPEEFKSALEDIKDVLQDLEGIDNIGLEKTVLDTVFMGGEKKEVKEAEDTFAGGEETDDKTKEYGQFSTQTGQRAEMFLNFNEVEDVGDISDIEDLIGLYKSGNKPKRFKWNGESGYIFEPDFSGEKELDWRIVKGDSPEFKEKLEDLGTISAGEGVLMTMDGDNLSPLNSGEEYIFVPHISSNEAESIVFSTIQKVSDELMKNSEEAKKTADKFEKISDDLAKKTGNDPQGSSWKKKLFGLVMGAAMTFNIFGGAVNDYVQASDSDAPSSSIEQVVDQDVKNDYINILDTEPEPGEDDTEPEPDEDTTSGGLSPDSLSDNIDNPSQFSSLLNSLGGLSNIAELITDSTATGYHNDATGGVSAWSPSEIQDIIDNFDNLNISTDTEGTITVYEVSLVSNTGDNPDTDALEYNMKKGGGDLDNERGEATSSATDSAIEKLQEKYPNLKFEKKVIKTDVESQKEMKSGNEALQGGLSIFDASGVMGDSGEEAPPTEKPTDTDKEQDPAAFLRTQDRPTAVISVEDALKTLKNVNRKSQIAIVLSVLNPEKANIYSMIRADEKAKNIIPTEHQEDGSSLTETELLKLSGAKGDQFKPSNPDLINLAKLIIALEKEKSESIRKMINQAFGQEVLLSAAKAKQSTPGKAREPEFKAGLKEHLFLEYLNQIQEGIVEDLLPKFLDKSNISDKKVEALALVGSMYAAEGSTMDNILPTVQYDVLDKIDPKFKEELKKYGFDPSSVGLGKRYKFMADVEKVKDRLDALPQLQRLLYRVDTQAELEDLLKGIIYYIDNKLAFQKTKVKSTFFKIKNTLAETMLKLKQEAEDEKGGGSKINPIASHDYDAQFRKDGGQGTGKDDKKDDKKDDQEDDQEDTKDVSQDDQKDTKDVPQTDKEKTKPTTDKKEPSKPGEEGEKLTPPREDEKGKKVPSDIASLYDQIEKNEQFQKLLLRINNPEELRQFIVGALLPYTKIYMRWKGIGKDYEGKGEDESAKKMIQAAIVAASNTFKGINTPEPEKDKEGETTTTDDKGEPVPDEVADKSDEELKDMGAKRNPDGTITPPTSGWTTTTTADDEDTKFEPSYSITKEELRKIVRDAIKETLKDQ
tara:strand:+ start:172 stop:3723 length:3552 start_codon:yes stop_codon:yes gene_type:complete